MSNLTLRLQTLHTLLSSKLWYIYSQLNLYRINLSHEFIHYIVNLIESLYIFQYSLRITYISDPKREYKCLDNLVDFQIAFKMCRKTISTKAKRNDRYPLLNKIELEKNI